MNAEEVELVKWICEGLFWIVIIFIVAKYVTS